MTALAESIAKLKSEITGHVSKLKTDESWAAVEKLFTALNTLEDLEKLPRTSLTELFGFASDGSVVVVHPGEFIGMDAVAAAKKFLDKKKSTASSLDEILEAIKTGGAQSVTREALGRSLARSTYDVVKADGQELYTLVEHTPHVSRGRKKKFTEPLDPPPSDDKEAAKP